MIDNGTTAFVEEGADHFITFLEEIANELDHIADKYPDQRLTPLSHIAVITEEWGESVQGILKKNYDDAQHEIAQTIACLIRLSHEIERVRSGQAAEEAHLYKDAQ